MKENSIEKRAPLALKEKGQYALAFGVIALMLYVVGFPVFMLFFFGVLVFFIWKAFASGSQNETRRIFEFYLSANEILRGDDRRWYGFEINETIARGEAILKSMSVAPALVHFSLGALYQKAGNHGLAVKYLAYVLEETFADESAIVFPTNELREYVKILRKIERAPADAKLTSAAVRSLERMRKNKGKALLDISRSHPSGDNRWLSDHKIDPDSPPATLGHEEALNTTSGTSAAYNEYFDPTESEKGIAYRFIDFAKSKKSKKFSSNTANTDRKTISEVLHDIYDRNIQ